MPHRNDWRVTTALFAATGLVESLAFGHLGAFTPLFLQELRVPASQVPAWTGWLSAIGFVIGLPLLPFWAVWSDRYGRKLIILRSSVAGALMFGLAAVSPTVHWLAAARFLSGFVLGNTGIMMALQADITPRDRLGRAVALISAGSPVGMAAGPYLGGLLVKAAGIRWLLAIDAILTVLIACLLAVMLREESRETGRPHPRAWHGVRAALGSVLATPAVATLFGVAFLVALGGSVGHAYVPLLVQRLYHGPEPGLAPTIGIVLTLSGIAMALATPLWGAAADRFGPRAVFRVCAIGSAAVLAGQAASASVAALTGWRGAYGVFAGGIGALGTVLLARYATREQRSAVLTLSLLPNQLSWFLGPLVGAWLAPASVRAPFWAGALIVAAGWAAAWRLPAVPSAGTDARPGER